MRFMLIDDDKAVRYMLEDIIEDFELGEIVESIDNAVDIDNNYLHIKNIDILIIDMLMPVRDGVETVKAIKENFTGKIIMLSQVEDKEMVGKAYALGVDYYITKPINRNEVVGVIRTACEHVNLQNFVSNVKDNLSNILNSDKSSEQKDKHSLAMAGKVILRDLGIAGESGGSDFVQMLQWLDNNGQQVEQSFPALKEIFVQIAKEKNVVDIKKEVKAMEQRIRRTIFQAMVNIASFGNVDCANPKFDDYAARYFDLAEIYAVMKKLEKEEKIQISQVHINSKRFIRTLYSDSNK